MGGALLVLQRRWQSLSTSIIISTMNQLPFAIRGIFALGLVMAMSIVPGSAVELRPYKERLFGYPGVLKPDGDDRYLIVDYRESRDINERDQIPERRVWARYISLKTRRVQKELQIGTPSGALKHFAVGKTAGASVITIYIHCKGGNRKQGVNDFTFGGNFNRLKNLMVRNGGLYLSPDVPGFDAAGATAIAALIEHYRAASADAKTIIACGSLGAEICYRLADDKRMAGNISGYVLLGAPPVASIFASPAFARKTPIFFGHGSRDTVYPIETVEAHFRRFITLKPDYPARFVRFETGTHGTPIRMTEWRSVINWILTQ